METHIIAFHSEQDCTTWEKHGYSNPLIIAVGPDCRKNRKYIYWFIVFNFKLRTTDNKILIICSFGLIINVIISHILYSQFSILKTLLIILIGEKTKYHIRQMFWSFLQTCIFADFILFKIGYGNNVNLTVSLFMQRNVHPKCTVKKGKAMNSWGSTESHSSHFRNRRWRQIGLWIVLGNRDIVSKDKLLLCLFKFHISTL